MSAPEAHIAHVAPNNPSNPASRRRGTQQTTPPPIVRVRDPGTPSEDKATAAASGIGRSNVNASVGLEAPPSPQGQSLELKFRALTKRKPAKPFNDLRRILDEEMTASPTTPI